MFEQVLGIVMTIIAVLLGGYNAFQKYNVVKGGLEGKMVYLIREANKLDIIGPEKMKVVVDKLYDMVPAAFKKFLTKEKIKDGAQTVYNQMKSFAEDENKENK